MKWTGWSALACAAALAVACDGNARDYGEASRQGRSSGTVGTSGQSRATSHGQDADARYFAEHAAITGNAEVELGQLATQHAQNPQVKEFAQMMVRDHSQAGAELKQTLSAHNVDAPQGLDVEHRQLKERLSSLSGPDFDREYMKAMVEGHQEVKSLLDGRTNSVHDLGPARPTGTSGDSPLDAAMTQWATRALPRVNEHLQKAEQIYAKVR
jgi:putative membrane protein